MLLGRFPRGSEWRKWDLQVHTPFSALNNGFGGELAPYAKELFEAAIAKRVAAIGVTDYFSIEGYKRLFTLRSDGAAFDTLLGPEQAKVARDILLLPNIEFRTSVIVTRTGRPDSRVNFHVLFSDELLPETIEEHFLRELKFTAQASPADPDERWSCTEANLANLGATLKKDHPEFRNRSNVHIGMLNAVISHEDVTDVLEGQRSRFRDKYLIITPADEDLSKVSWNGQAHLTRKLFLQKSHFLFASNANTRAFGLGLTHPSEGAYLEEFKTKKACVHGSDAHDYDHLFEPDEARYLWVKADPTFEGLRQLLHEPADRVFIGKIPPDLETKSTRLTRIIDSVDITRAPFATTPETWFDSHLPLNPSLVAVIGNKGSGKSALADVVALLGNTRRARSFAFLREERFRDPRQNKAKQFQASLSWADGTSSGPQSLATDPPREAVEKVKYVPQNYLEEICNEVGLGSQSRFYRELQEVIFSHVPPAERLGFHTLDELLAHRGEEVNKGLTQLIAELSDTNRGLAALEQQLTPRHRRALELQLVEKRRELEALDQSRPAPVVKPDEDPASLAQSRQAASRLEALHVEQDALHAAIEALTNTDITLAKKAAAVDRLLTKLRNLQRHVEASLLEAAPDLIEAGVTHDQIIRFEVLPSPLDELRESIQQERAEVQANLDPLAESGTARRATDVDQQIAALRESLSAPQRAYEEYSTTLRAWELKREGVVGTKDKTGSIRMLEATLSALDSLPRQILSHKRIRRRKALELLREKQRLRSYYEAYYGAVQKFLGKHPLAETGILRVTFDVSMVEAGFADVFLEKVNQRKSGYFAGIEEGRAAVKAVTEATNWNSAKDCIRFAEGIIERLESGVDEDRGIQDQLIQGQSVQGLYDLVFSFGYVTPIYRLTWDGKGLEQLSPGERGNLLLIFYLLVDRDDIPLVIDQPEENLDNQTVVRTLVPCIRDAKRRRQIMMVTHNPNLAVVCDAEQVIYAEIRKDMSNAVSYMSGSIEDLGTNQKVVDVLEGTRPAFDQRDARYQP